MKIKFDVANGWGSGAMAMGVLVGVALLALAASMVRVPASPLGAEIAAEGRQAPSLVISRADRLPAVGGLREKLWLLNPSPLYMPVAMPVGLGVGPTGMPERPGGRAAEMFAPELFYAERSPGSAILRPKAPATAAAAADDLANGRWFNGMTRSGEVGGPVSIPEVRAARFTLYRYGAGARAAEATLDLVADEVLGSNAWRPVELTVVIDATGAVSRPTLMASTGEEQVDDRIRELTGRDFLSNLVLRPGIYRIEVGP